MNSQQKMKIYKKVIQSSVDRIPQCQLFLLKMAPNKSHGGRCVEDGHFEFFVEPGTFGHVIH